MKTMIQLKDANPICSKMLSRAKKEVSYCGYRRTAADIGISVNTLRKMINQEEASYLSWEKLASWTESWNL